MRTVNHGIDRVRVTFEEGSLIADAGLVRVATVAARLALEDLLNTTLRLVARVGGDRSRRKVLTPGARHGSPGWTVSTTPIGFGLARPGRCSGIA